MFSGTSIAKSQESGGYSMGSYFKRLATLVAFSILGVSPISFAGPGSGGGGKGVLINGKPYLFDLVEGGVERNPYFDPKVSAAPEFLSATREVFKNMPEAPVDLIARKLTEVSQVQYIFGLLMLKTMQQFEWKFVNQQPTDVNDHRQGIRAKEVQLAKRLNRSIIIYRPLALKMTPENLTALIFHEINYAYAKLKRGNQGYMYQDIGAVQEFTAFLFTRPTRGSTEISDQFSEMIREIFPEDLIGLGSGGIVKDGDRFWFIEVDPVLNIKTTKDRLDGEGVVIESLEGISIFNDLRDNESMFVTEFVKEKACKALKENPTHKALKYEILRPRRIFSVEFYEYDSGQLRSYVKVTEQSGKDSGFPIEIGNQTCEVVAEKIANEGSRAAVRGFHRNY